MYLLFMSPCKRFYELSVIIITTPQVLTNYSLFQLVEFKWPAFTSKIRICCNFSVNTTIKYQ